LEKFIVSLILNLSIFESTGSIMTEYFSKSGGPCIYGYCCGDNKIVTKNIIKINNTHFHFRTHDIIYDKSTLAGFDNKIPATKIPTTKARQAE
jgi:hypothetical protein